MPTRYARQLAIPGIGRDGQTRLARSRVLVLGAGGLGFPVLTYLGAAGVGAVTFVDPDVVEPSNLNRQCLFSEADVGRGKAEAALERLTALNSEVRWQPVAAALTPELASRLLVGTDLAIDCADNWEARFALASSAWRVDVPLVHGAVAALEGTVAVFRPPSGPCFSCLYPEAGAGEPPPVLGAAVGVVGSLMATEAIRLLCGSSPWKPGQVLLIDLERRSFDWVTGAQRAGCPICGSGG